MAAKWNGVGEVAPAGRCDTHTDGARLDTWDTCCILTGTLSATHTHSGRWWEPLLPPKILCYSLIRVTSLRSSTKLTKLCLTLHCHGDPPPWWGRAESKEGSTAQRFPSLLSWESPGCLVHGAVSAVFQVLGGPDGAQASLEQAVKLILWRRDVGKYWWGGRKEPEIWYHKPWFWILRKRFLNCKPRGCTVKRRRM